MLDSIEELHDHGYIHRDIKPSNFVMGKNSTRKQVFMIDFGLAKMHLGKDSQPLEQQPKAEFRGSLAYASLNAHMKIVSGETPVGPGTEGRHVELLLRGSGLPQRNVALAFVQGQ